MPDYYKLLGLAKGAQGEEIKAAYRSLALKFHPDHNPNNVHVERQFQLISEAYQVLHDSEEKGFYDRFGLKKERLEKMARSSPTGRRLEGLVGNVIDEVLGTGKRKPASGKDHRYRLEISFEEACLGGEKELHYRHHTHCASCDGLGRESEAPEAWEVCHVCGGSGEMKLSQSGLLPFKRICEFCEGRGFSILKPCRTCHGLGTAEMERTLIVQIPPGVESGKRLRVRGAGAPGRFGGASGDLYIELEVASHPFFRRSGSDIEVGLPVDVRTAVLGGQVEVPTLKGVVRITIPPGTQNGDKLRLKGEGVPSGNRGGSGDLYFLVGIEVPDLGATEAEVLTRGWLDLPPERHPQMWEFHQWISSNRRLPEREES